MSQTHTLVAESTLPWTHVIVFYSDFDSPWFTFELTTVHVLLVDVLVASALDEELLQTLFV